MAIVSSTAVFKIGPQDIEKLRNSEHVHSSKKRLRRTRKTEAFHNVIFKYPNGKIVFLIYQNGKVVALGSKNSEELDKSSRWLSKVLGSPIIEKPVISNYVFTYASCMQNTDRGDTLIRVYKTIKELSSENKRFIAHLEPELSPALVYHPSCNVNAKAMMFRSGKIMITGLRTEDDIVKVKKEIDHILSL